MQHLNIILLFFALSSITSLSAQSFKKGPANRINIVRCASKVGFKYPKPNATYKVGADIYVNVDPQRYQDIKRIELFLNGKFVRKESQYPFEWCKGSGNSDAVLRNMKAGKYQLKARVFDQCGAHKDYFLRFQVLGMQLYNPTIKAVCKYKSWFKYPKNNASYRYGSDVYVRVDTERYQDISEMQLFINGHFVRKESQYPFEWCKGSGNSDPYLRNLKRGTYNLKCRVKTKCGRWYEYYCKFYVR